MLAAFQRSDANPLNVAKGPGHGLARTRFIRELFRGRYRPGQSVQLDRKSVG